MTGDLNSDKGEVGGRWFKSTQAHHLFCCPKNLNPHSSAHFTAPAAYPLPGRQIFPLRRQCFIAVVLRVQIECRLNPRVTQDAEFL
jgi:hypothetical protein